MTKLKQVMKRPSIESEADLIAITRALKHSVEAWADEGKLKPGMAFRFATIDMILCFHAIGRLSTFAAKRDMLRTQVRALFIPSMDFLHFWIGIAITVILSSWVMYALSLDTLFAVLVAALLGFYILFIAYAMIRPDCQRLRRDGESLEDWYVRSHEEGAISALPLPEVGV